MKMKRFLALLLVFVLAGGVAAASPATNRCLTNYDLLRMTLSSVVESEGISVKTESAPAQLSLYFSVPGGYMLLLGIDAGGNGVSTRWDQLDQNFVVKAMAYFCENFSDMNFDALPFVVSADLGRGQSVVCTTQEQADAFLSTLNLEKHDFSLSKEDAADPLGTQEWFSEHFDANSRPYKNTCPNCGVCWSNGEMTAPDLPPVSPLRYDGILTFGHYEQDNDPQNGEEAIEWMVLDIDSDNGQILLISRYALDAMAFTTGGDAPTWAQSDVRAWLNGEFLESAFTQQEQKAIVPTALSERARRAGYETGAVIDGGADTVDPVFLFDDRELYYYFDFEIGNDYYFSFKRSDAGARPTAYAAAKLGASDARVGSDGEEAYREWWLRSLAGIKSVDCVKGDGTLTVRDAGEKNTVRPALWLDLNACSFRWTCGACGRENQLSYAFCPACGARRDGEKTTAG